MNLDNWTRFYKYNDLDRADQNNVYVPYISPDKQTYCMDYSNSNNFFFENEVKWLDHLQNETYVPEVIDIDTSKKYITFKWYDTSLNHLFFNHNLQHLEQAQTVLKNLERSNILKLNYFPHTCYVDDNDNVRIHDLYGCASSYQSKVSFDIIEPILNDITKFYYQQNVQDGMIDLHNMHVDGINKNQGNWPKCLTSTLLTY